MPTFATSRKVGYTPQEMFALVADIEKYPGFLPLCTGLKILRRERDEEDREVLVARMSVGYRHIAESFTSRVTLDPERSRIVAEYVDGPFSHLTNRWTFTPDGSGCEVGFFISYEFRSRMLGMMMGAAFERAFHKFSEAFETRARQIYGPPAA
ncbi:type II toxin-antitoxin system RatA family toxin [Camelimonas abortus]|uniref:Type II toxin-antitoxin system RatA family toxin n=1 Tax=Camelimonas abortus TaxID=1017184 RepID=A0ABV7LE72_9HYPH